MKISKLSVGSISVPLHHPFRTALRTVTSVDDLVVRLETDDGLIGYGEAAPTPVITGDTRGGILEGFSIAGRAIMGLRLDEPETIFNRLAGSMVHNTSAKAALHMAIWDLIARSYGQPLNAVLGGARRWLECDLTISLNDPEQMAADSRAAVAQGFGILKVKIGTDAQLDLERLKAVRAAVGSGVRLRLDANQGWKPDEAIRVMHKIEDAGVDPDLVEQPVKANDLEGLARVTAAVDTPVLADEAIFSPLDAERVITSHAADMINIKLMKTGGIWQALKIVALAEINQVEVMMGSMMESAVSVTAAAQLAMARSCFTMIDLDPPMLCSANPVRGGMAWQGSRITLPEAPGLGIDGIDGVGFQELR